jgi:hypothetical protein
LLISCLACPFWNWSVSDERCSKLVVCEYVWTDC